MSDFADLNPPQRLLVGPGPSPVHPHVQRAMAAPSLGHLDPELLRLRSETSELLRYAFQTKNELTLAVSGTGMSGMECVLRNLIEPRLPGRGRGGLLRGARGGARRAHGRSRAPGRVV